MELKMISDKVKLMYYEILLNNTGKFGWTIVNDNIDRLYGELYDSRADQYLTFPEWLALELKKK